jgi:hypothetical protein
MGQFFHVRSNAAEAPDGKRPPDCRESQERAQEQRISVERRQAPQLGNALRHGLSASLATEEVQILKRLPVFSSALMRMRKF